ncbi:unnamed protein product [Periconia digitata]|uniref:Uncharacterized protein n=1 Tax=Periconia digitata TaxID=1303443 RepID=A0A9W4US36_9PLEO|nr:unnamed protein product [Periconia digitata]
MSPQSWREILDFCFGNSGRELISLCISCILFFTFLPGRPYTDVRFVDTMDGGRGISSLERCKAL